MYVSYNWTVINVKHVIKVTNIDVNLNVCVNVKQPYIEQGRLGSVTLVNFSSLQNDKST